MPEEADWQRRARLAADALADAKADARAKGTAPPARGAGRPGRDGGGRRRGGRARREDPQPLGAALDGLLADQGWQLAAAVGSVFGRWDQLVGPDVAAHTRPERFTDGELVVTADSAAWATQMRLLTSAVVRRLNTELGHGTVTRVVVRGPVPPRRMGPLRVRGTGEHNSDYG